METLLQKLNYQPNGLTPEEIKIPQKRLLISLETTLYILPEKIFGNFTKAGFVKMQLLLMQKSKRKWYSFIPV